jgi:putative membrane protein
MNIFLRWLINAASLMIIASVVSGVEINGWYSAFIAALVLGLINVFLKPILIILTLPVNILTLGLFTLLINALLFNFAGSIVKGFDVSGFGAAFFGALLMTGINILVHSIFKKNKKDGI